MMVGGTARKFGAFDRMFGKWFCAYRGGFAGLTEELGRSFLKKLYIFGTPIFLFVSGRI